MMGEEIWLGWLRCGHEKRARELLIQAVPRSTPSDTLEFSCILLLLFWKPKSLPTSQAPYRFHPRL